MAATQNVKLLRELSQVSPPPQSIAATTLPLTLFDAFFLTRPDIRRILFYQLHPPNNTTNHFLTFILPKLKHSLSLALQLFFPLAANLTQTSGGGDHEFRYVDGGSVSLTVVESDADFNHLTANYPREFSELHPLIPELHPPSLLSLQFTVFPDAGFSIGYRARHVVADGSCLNHFMKSWASICRSGDISAVTNLPSYDRTPVAHLDHLKRSLMEEFQNTKPNQFSNGPNVDPPTKGIRATFTLTRDDVEKLRQSLVAQRKPFTDTSHSTRFVITCAYAWVSMLKATGEEGDHSELEGKTATLLIPVDCRARLDPHLPPTYFGNCLGACFAEARLSDLLGEDGFGAASEAIGTAIRSFISDEVMKDAESWNSRINASARLAAVGASPKFRVYDTDFGWGRPKKTELIPNRLSRVIYMGDSRDEEGGIDVNVALDEQEMKVFASLFEEGLKNSATFIGSIETNS